METGLSQNEREALSHFLSRIISDVEKIAALFESRGADATMTRAAQANLESTLEQLRTGEFEMLKLRTFASGKF